MTRFLPVFAALIFACSVSCRKTAEKAVLSAETAVTKAEDSVRYAKGFRIENGSGFTRISVLNPWNGNRILQAYVLVPRNAALPEKLPEGTLIRTPLERTVCYNSVQCSFFNEIGVLNTLVGVCEPNQIRMSQIADAVREKRIANLGMAANPDIEKLMLAEPEAIFATPFEGTDYGAVIRLGIPIIQCPDYMEQSPLGRAEWIRFFAQFFERNNEADSLFRTTEQHYNETKKLTVKSARRPTVFSETMYGGVWYLPGGGSYMAKLFADAGADYIWKDDEHAGSLGLPLEAVLEKAENADFWLIKYSSGNALTYNSLKSENSNYALFAAWKNRKIFACNTGKIAYYEETAVHPDRLLNNLAAIFHPEIHASAEYSYFENPESDKNGQF